jgi:ribonuclease-3 family protein
MNEDGMANEVAQENVDESAGENSKNNTGDSAGENAGNGVKESAGINERIGEHFPLLLKGNANQFSPLVLAYIGDAVYELHVRTLLLSQGNAPVHKLHKQSIEFVKAKAQSDIIHRLMNILSEEEQDIVRRGRNAKSGTIPKNADVAEYKYATGFETLLGYLYVKGDYTRLLELLDLSVGRSRDGI